MEDFILEGERYVALFQLYRKVNDSKTHKYSVWKTSPHMWWTGMIKIMDKESGNDARATFETLHRADVPDGIRTETLEQSLLLVRGVNEKSEFVSHKDGGSILFNRKGATDYLLCQVYEKILEDREIIIFPRVDIPLLEQHDLAKHGFALEEPRKITSR